MIMKILFCENSTKSLFYRYNGEKKPHPFSLQLNILFYKLCCSCRFDYNEYVFQANLNWILLLIHKLLRWCGVV